MELRFPSMRYDHTMPLVEGKVRIPGVELKIEEQLPMAWDDIPDLRTGKFGLWDLNTGYWPSAIENGWQLVGLPLFIKRKTVHQYLWVRNDRSIESPKDLEGKLIGTSAFPTGITITLGGILSDRYGVDLHKLRWLSNRSSNVFKLHKKIDIKLASGPEKDPWDRLLDGEVDAIISDISFGDIWRRLESDQRIRRLFPDYMLEDRNVYQEMGIYPPMHMIVMSRKLDQERPDFARLVYEAFDAAKAQAYTDILNDRAGFSVVYLRERLEQQIAEWGDPWVYGVAANRRMIDAFNRYNFEQGITSRMLSDEELFAGSTVDT